MGYRLLLHPALCVVLLGSCGEPDRPLAIEVWHGSEQRVGHLGDAQDDFNLMGVVSGNEFTYSVNGGAPKPLFVTFDEFGFRRLGASGHFNADVPIAALKPGENSIEIVARNSEGERSLQTTLRRDLEGSAELPFTIRWSDVRDPQDVGQYVDGRWDLEPGGLRTKEPLYDRVFLVGNRSWTDYRVTSTVTVHEVPEKTGPKSGGAGLGVILRFAGHSIAPPRFPEAQPKWGYQPFGAIAWLRWSKTEPAAAPVRQFYRGDRDAFESMAPLSSFRLGATYGITLECETSAADPNTTTFRMRVWPIDEQEPAGWDFEVAQTSETALRAGGVALVAHHVAVTFGDVTVVGLPSATTR